MKHNTILPYWNVKNIRIYYLLTILTNCWFMLPNWMFLYALYLTKQQIGVIEAVAIIMGILIEVPTGVFSDVFGKKISLILANALIFISAVVLSFANSYPLFLLGNCLVFLGFAFASGSYEAFGYDSLVEKGKEKEYDRVVSKSTALSLGASLISVLLGGWLFSFNPAYPMMAWAITSFIATVLMFFAKEPAVDTSKVSVSGYIHTLWDGVSSIFSIRFRDILIPVLVIAMLAKLHFGVVRQSTAMYFGFNGETFAYVLALAMLLTIFISSKFDRIKKKLGSHKILLYGLIGFIFINVLSALTSNRYVGFIYFFAFAVINIISEQASSVAANERLESKHRATSLSVIALFGKIPYVVLMFFFVYLTESSYIPTLTLGFATVSFLTLLYILLLEKKIQDWYVRSRK